jgi:voltage-gated potassium channel
MADSRYVLRRERTHDVLEKAASPDDIVSKVADIVLLVLIVGNLAAVTLETVESIDAQFGLFFEAFDRFSVAVFSVEYVLRVWACASDPRYSDGPRGRLRYARSATAIIDLLAVLPSYFPSTFFDARAIRTFRLFRLLRLMKVGRYTRSAQTLMHVMTTKKEELYTAVFAQLVLISVASSLMYYVEYQAQPNVFASVPHAMCGVCRR